MNRHAPIRPRLREPAPSRARMRGVVLLFTLIALVIMLIGAVALIRSFNTTLGTAGNLAFKRDLQNQAERVLPTVLALMQTGALSTATDRAAHKKASNYSASILLSNDQGIPNALLDNSADNAVFATVGSVGNDIALSTERIEIRYLIDRQCRSTGEEALLGADNCLVSINSGASPGGSQEKQAEFSAPGAALAASAAGAAAAAAASTAAGAGGVPPQVVYRLSIRITGPRNTQAYFQTTFTL